MLAPYVERGEVVIRDWPMELGQRPAYDDCIAEHGRDARWIAFIDLDEFLFSPTGQAAARDAAAHTSAGPAWASTGPCSAPRDTLTRPPGLVTESYIETPANGREPDIKTIADPLRVDRAAGVHRFTYKSLGHVDENQYPITAGSRRPSRARCCRSTTT